MVLAWRMVKLDYPIANLMRDCFAGHRTLLDQASAVSKSTPIVRPINSENVAPDHEHFIAMAIIAMLALSS